MAETIIKISNMDKSFGVVRALQQVNFSVGSGEIHGLIGENGSGKSTVSSIIAGMQSADSGEMEFLGKPYQPADTVKATEAGVSMVVQEMGTISGITVAENLFLGREHLFCKAGFMNVGKMNRQAQELIDQAGIENIKASDLIDYYSFEERKLIEIVRALSSNPRLLIIDETTTALSLNGRNILYRIMKEMAEKGNSVLFISHDLEELMSICNILTVLRDGIIIDTIPKERFDAEDIKLKMVGREIKGDYYRADYACTFDKEVRMRMEHVCTHVLYDINLELHKSEILGISGLSESGIHDIGRLAYGIETPIYGKVSLPEIGSEVKNPLQSIHDKIGYVSKDRDKESLILRDSIKNNILINAYDRVKSGPFISGKKEKKFAQEQIDFLRIKCFDMTQFVSTLSGGNKQKVAFSRWMGVDTDVLILDCPTRGVDIGVKSAMYQLMTELKKQGKSLLVISEEMSELIGMCDRILVVKDGKINGEFERSQDLTEQKIIQCMI
ncbi:MAG: sugar ABC transporter ATP-binding protein [Clostridiales bacterium]|nr:sugar ABC transporter ATP-binding protein [Clostridiales bacterium]